MKKNLSLLLSVATVALSFSALEAHAQTVSREMLNQQIETYLHSHSTPVTGSSSARTRAREANRLLRTSLQVCSSKFLTYQTDVAGVNSDSRTIISASRRVLADFASARSQVLRSVRNAILTEAGAGNIAISPATVGAADAQDVASGNAALITEVSQQALTRMTLRPSLRDGSGRALTSAEFDASTASSTVSLRRMTPPISIAALNYSHSSAESRGFNRFDVRYNGSTNSVELTFCWQSDGAMPALASFGRDASDHSVNARRRGCSNMDLATGQITHSGEALRYSEELEALGGHGLNTEHPIRDILLTREELSSASRVAAQATRLQDRVMQDVSRDHFPPSVEYPSGLGWHPTEASCSAVVDSTLVAARRAEGLRANPFFDADSALDSGSVRASDESGWNPSAPPLSSAPSISVPASTSLESTDESGWGSAASE